MSLRTYYFRGTVQRLLCILACISTLPACANAVEGGARVDGGNIVPGDDASPDTRPDASLPAFFCDDIPGGWSRVGPPIDPPGGVYGVGDVAIDAEGRAIVAIAGSAPFDGYAYRYEDGAWQQLGEPFDVNDGGNVYFMSVRAVARDLVVMFLEAGGDTSTGVYVQRLADGANTWETMGGGDLSTTNANVVGGDMFINGDEVLVAWSQYSDGVIGRSRVHIRRFTGDAYVPLNPLMGGIAGPGASAITPSIVVDAAGNEVVVFSESGVRHLERNSAGTDWTVHPEVNPSGTSTSGFGPHAATDSLGRVLMVMGQYDSPSQQSIAHLQRWNGASWDALGSYQGSPLANTHTTAADLLLDANDAPILAVTEPAQAGQPAKLSIVRRTAGDVFEVLGGGVLVGGDGTQAISGAKMTRDPCGFHVIFNESISAGSEPSLHVFRWKDE